MKSLLFIFLVFGVSCNFVNAASVGKTQIIEAAIKECKGLTSLINPSALGSSAFFPEPDGVVAVLIQGIKPPPSMKNQVGAELCLYSLHEKTARLANWDALARSKDLPTYIRPPSNL